MTSAFDRRFTARTLPEDDDTDDDNVNGIRRNDVIRGRFPLKHRRRAPSPVDSDSTATSTSSMMSRGRPDGGHHVRHVTGQSNVTQLYPTYTGKSDVVYMRKLKERERRKRRYQNYKQLNAYTTWVNSHLKKRTGSRQIHDLKLDIRDGVALIQLLETLSGEYLGGNADPQSYVDMKDNVQRVIDFMHDRRIRMHRTQASDVVEGNIKSIMRMILAVAVHYQPDSVKQSVHQQQVAAALAETRRDVINHGHRVRRADPRSSDESHDYANMDSRAFADSTPLNLPNYHSKNRQGSRGNHIIQQRSSRDDVIHKGRDSKENLVSDSYRYNHGHMQDGRDSRNSAEIYRQMPYQKERRRDFVGQDAVDGRYRQGVPRAVKQRSRSKDHLNNSDSDEEQRGARRQLIDNRGVDARHAVPWRVQPRPSDEANVRNVRASGGMVKSRSLDFDNVSSEESPVETSSFASSMPRSVSVQPLTSTRAPNTPAATTPIKTTPIGRGPVIPYAPVVPGPSTPSLNSTETPQAPAPSLASTRTNITPSSLGTSPMTSSLRHDDVVVPTNTLVENYNDSMENTSAVSDNGCAPYMDDAMMDLVDNLTVDHEDLADELAETKQILLKLQNLLVEGDEEMSPLKNCERRNDTSSTEEEIVILKNQLVQSEVVVTSLQEEFTALKAQNQQLINEKTVLKQKLMEQERCSLEIKAELTRIGQNGDSWQKERNEHNKQVKEREMTIRELKRDLAYKDRLICQLQADLETEMDDKENISRHLKSQLHHLHDKMKRFGESEAQITSKLASQDQAMTRIEGRMSTQRQASVPQDQMYQDEIDHMKDVLRSLRQNLSRNDPQHKAVDCLDGALTRLAQHLHFSVPLPGRKSLDQTRRVPLDVNEPRCSPVAAVQGFPIQPQNNKPYQPIQPRQYVADVKTYEMTTSSAIATSTAYSQQLQHHQQQTQRHVITNSQPSAKNMISSNQMMTSSSNSGTSSSQTTKVLYFTDMTVTPFLCTIPKRLGEMTLADFKQVYDKPGKYRYHFKSIDPEFGTVKEEVTCDDDILPGCEGKVVAWIEEDRG